MEGNGDSKCKPVIMTADLVNDNILLEMAEAKYLNVLELKRLFFADIIDSSFVLSINFEHQNLLNIASLWRLSSLTKLVLANNFIKDIESLECMPNLQFLDLSFNCIETINGLNDHLNLLYLNLSFNKITVLENMDHIIKLETFLVRYNKLKTFNNIHYLKQFEYLLCLGVDGNPFLSFENNRPCIIAVLPQLQFLDFQIVTQQEKNALKSQPIIEKVGVIAKSAKYPSISLNKPVCYSWTKSTADKEAFVEGLANGQGLKRLLNSSDNFRALHSFPLVADLAENYCIKVCQVFDKWYDKGYEYYKQMQAEKTDFTEMVEEVQKHSLGLIKEHYELYIDLKEEMPKELCLISQKHTSSDQQDFMVQALKEKYIKEMKNTHKNVMDALRMSTENVYKLHKTFEYEMLRIKSCYLKDVKDCFKEIMCIEDFYISQLMDFYMNLFESGTNFDLEFKNQFQEVKLESIFSKLLTKKDYVEMALKMGTTIHSSLLQERINNLENLLESFVMEAKNNSIGSILVKQNELTRDIIIFCRKQMYTIDKIFSSNTILKHYLGYM